jgi:lipoyl(octanoyl) transferase
VAGQLRYVRAGFGDAAVPYDLAWDEQRRLHDARIHDLVPDTVLLLEHPPVYTAGKRTEPQDRPADGTPVVEVDRGGKITWHGPGQLVGYPIIKLPERLYVVDYVRRLEAALIGACADLGLQTTRVKGPRGVTMHGFALNCDCDLSWFARIVPCGITDAGVTSLSQELRRPVSVAAAADLVERHLAEALGATSYETATAQQEAPAGTLV